MKICNSTEKSSQPTLVCLNLERNGEKKKTIACRNQLYNLKNYFLCFLYIPYST